MSHNHAHEGEVGRLVRVGFIMFVFGGFEMLIARLGHNSLLAADAAHNLTDGVFPLFSAVIGVSAAGSQNHLFACRLKNIATLTGYSVMVVLVAWAAWSERHGLSHLSRRELQLTAYVALAGALVNIVGHRHLEHGSHLEKSNKLHLLSDIVISFVIMLSALLGLIWQSPLPGEVGLLVAVAIVAVLVFRHSHEVISDLHIGRPHVDHDDDHLPPHHH